VKRPEPFYSLEDINKFSENWTRLTFDEKKSHTELLNICSIDLGRAYWYEYQLTKYALELEAEIKELKKKGNGLLTLSYLVLEKGGFGIIIVVMSWNTWN
jgi:hypothetical protein